MKNDRLFILIFELNVKLKKERQIIEDINAFYIL